MLPCFDAPPGGPFRPFPCYPGPPGRTWRRPLHSCGVASPQAPTLDRESRPATIPQPMRVGPNSCWLDGTLGATNSSAPFRNCTEAFDTAGGCRREAIFDEKSITYRRGSVRNLLILRTGSFHPDRLLASSTLLCPFLTSAQNVSSQPPKQNQREPARSQFRRKISRLVRKSLTGRDRVTTPEERTSSAGRKTLRSAEGRLNQGRDRRDLQRARHRGGRR